MIKKPIRVLVADDDSQILQVYESLLGMASPATSPARLQALGSELFDTPIAKDDDRPIQTTTCQQGSEAVRLASEALRLGRRFDAIVLDIRMPPGISGVDAAECIREFDPTVPIIFVTGYADLEMDAIFQRIPPPDRLRYFTKPVQFVELATTITEVAAL